MDPILHLKYLICVREYAPADILNKPPIAANIVANSISAGLPRDRMRALSAVKETKGAYICVHDEEILTAAKDDASGGRIIS